MANSLFIKADEVAELLGVSRAEAYRIIKRLNDQLSSRGFIVVNGRVNAEAVRRQYDIRKLRAAVREGRQAQDQAEHLADQGEHHQAEDPALFRKKKLSEITAKDVIDWQNEMRSMKNDKGKPFSKTYLKTLHNQLSCLFNHAVRFYGLGTNPAQKAGNMGTEEKKEMLFWTKAEYDKFIEVVMDKPITYYAFEILYWCGLRLGEMLALTPADFDFERGTVSVTKSYQRIHGEDVITPPKTKKSVRVVQMPPFLCDEIQDYIKRLHGAESDTRIFPISKHQLHSEMSRGSKAAGVKRIRIHDLRHSHISLLIDQGFTALAIADRVGHESIDITYRYAHLFPTRQAEMADKLDQLKWQKGA